MHDQDDPAQRDHDTRTETLSIGRDPSNRALERAAWAAVLGLAIALVPWLLLVGGYHAPGFDPYAGRIADGRGELVEDHYIVLLNLVPWGVLLGLVAFSMGAFALRKWPGNRSEG